MFTMTISWISFRFERSRAKVKVTVASFRKTLCHYSSAFAPPSKPKWKETHTQIEKRLLQHKIKLDSYYSGDHIFGDCTHTVEELQQKYRLWTVDNRLLVGGFN